MKFITLLLFAMLATFTTQAQVKHVEGEKEFFPPKPCHAASYQRADQSQPAQEKVNYFFFSVPEFTKVKNHSPFYEQVGRVKANGAIDFALQEPQNGKPESIERNSRDFYLNKTMHDKTESLALQQIESFFCLLAGCDRKNVPCFTLNCKNAYKGICCPRRGKVFELRSFSFLGHAALCSIGNNIGKREIPFLVKVKRFNFAFVGSHRHSLL